jgi:hypothetical protein
MRDAGWASIVIVVLAGVFAIAKYILHEVAELARAVVQAVEAVREAKSELRCDRAEKEGPQALASPTVDLRVKGSSSQREGPRKRA